MTPADGIILIVDHTAARASNLKSLIEFLDTPRVCTATSSEWRGRLGDNRLEALFVGPDLLEDDLQRLLGDVRKMDPNVPIVIMQAEGRR